MRRVPAAVRRPYSLILLCLAPAGFALALLAGCSEDDIERSMGRRSVAAIESHFKIVDDPLVSGWVQYVGQSCVGSSRRQKIPYEFKVIDTEIVNALAVPYGHVYLTMGLLEFAETEDEVWAVTGHEVGHIVNRDSIKSFKKSLIYSIPTFFAAGESRLAGDLTSTFFDLWGLHYSRVDEYEADDKGTELSFAAGYDPHAQLVFFQRLADKYEKERPSKFETYFLTHPPLVRRIARQKNRPEFSPDNPEVELTIADSYLRRHRPRKAAELYSRVLKLTPGNARALVGLGQAHLALGAYEPARQNFQAALAAEPGSAAAQRGLRLIAHVSPASPERPAAGDQLARARALFAQTRQCLQQAEASERALADYRQTTEGALAPVATSARDAAGSLVDLSGSIGTLGEASDRLMVRAKMAVATANEALYALEAGDLLVTDSTGRALGALRRAERLLDAALKHGGPMPDLDLLEHSVAQSRVALQAVREYTRQAPRDFELLSSAADAAGHTVGAMERVAIHPDEMSRQELADTLADTDSRGFEALAAANKPRKIADQAQTSALLAEIDVLTAGATPAQQQIADRIIAYFLQAPQQDHPPTQARDVRALRDKGLGFGDAALILAASCSTGQSPEALLAQRGVSRIDAVRRQGARLRYLNIFLKFIANALREELAPAKPLPSITLTAATD